MFKRTIYYHDTDAGGVVYYARYLEFLEQGRTEYLRDYGVDIVQEIDQGYVYAVKRCNIEYLSPAKYGDCVIIHSAIKEVTSARIIFEQSIEIESKKKAIQASIELVCLNQKFKPTRIPDHVRSKIVCDS